MTAAAKPTREDAIIDVLADSCHDLAPEPGKSAAESKSNWRNYVASHRKEDGSFDAEGFFGNNRKGYMEYMQFVNKFDVDKRAKATKRRIIRR